MNSFRALLAFIGVCVSQFRRTYGLRFHLAILCLATSRILQTIALFLPIKILLLLSGSGAPSILEMVPLEADVVIALLMAGLPVFYAGAILLGAWFQRLIDTAAAPVAPEINGVPMPAKQYLRLHDAIVRISADCLVIVAGLASILIFSWPFALASVLILGLYGLIMEMKIFGSQVNRYTWLKLKDSQFLEYGRTSTFIVLFGVLALLVVYFNMNVYLAILAMLIARLMSQSVQRFFSAAFKHRKTYAKWIIQRAAIGKSVPPPDPT